MKKFFKKRELSESSEDADDPGAFNPSPGRAGGMPTVGGHRPPSPEPFRPDRSMIGLGRAAQSYTEQEYLSSYSTQSGFQGYSNEFKRPKLDGDSGRRFSQASTNSSASLCDDEASVDRDAALLSRTLDSTSSSDTEDEKLTSPQPNSAPKNGFYGAEKPTMLQHQDSWDEGGGGGSSAPPKSGGYSNQAERMMSLMGYKSGSGLGKAKQGRVELVPFSNQRGRRGLGHIIEGLESDGTVDWVPEEITVNEKVSWIPSNQQPTPSLQELKSWLRSGERSEDISEEDRFCDPEVLKDVLSCKSVFDKLEAHEMMKARTRSNPFETIGKGIFQNRAAMKMANMDAVFDFMFTDPRQDGRSLVKPDEPLYFADVCAGPGGFSEYVLWKKKWRAKGFGFTLKDGKHDFKLEEFYAGPPEGFECYYGVDGYHGDGNIFRTDNIQELRQFVLSSSGFKGVHFMMADGGFSVEGSENIQEILSKQLYLCQIIVALAIVRERGHFVCKLFDLFTPFSVGLIYLMYRSFEQVCIHKPNTSRPANSERYIICKHKRPDTEHILQYLLEVNHMLEELKFDLSGRTTSNEDIVQLVPEQVMEQDQEFLQYMIESNNQIGKYQISGLEKIAIFYKNRELYEKRQADIRKQSLEFWQVPDGGRIKPRFEDPQQMVQRLLNSTSLLKDEGVLVKNTEDLSKNIKSIYDWRYVVIGTRQNYCDSMPVQEIRTFLVSTGRQRVSFYTQNGRWQALNTLSNCRIDLPAETILYAEVLWEMKGESKAQKKVMSIHVIDAMFLAGEDVRSHHFNERNRLLSIFLKVMNKPSQNDLVRLRPKIMFKLEDCLTDNAVWSHLDTRNLKGRRDCLVFTNPEQDQDGNNKFFQAKGLLLYRHVKDPYIMAMSKSQNRKYFFNTRKNKPVENFQTPKDGIAEFEFCHSNRLLWNFNNPAYQDDGGSLQREDFLEFIRKIKQ